MHLLISILDFSSAQRICKCARNADSRRWTEYTSIARPLAVRCVNVSRAKSLFMSRPLTFANRIRKVLDESVSRLDRKTALRLHWARVTAVARYKIESVSRPVPAKAPERKNGGSA